MAEHENDTPLAEQVAWLREGERVRRRERSKRRQRQIAVGNQISLVSEDKWTDGEDGWHIQASSGAHVRVRKMPPGRAQREVLADAHLMCLNGVSA